MKSVKVVWTSNQCMWWRYDASKNTSRSSLLYTRTYNRRTHTDTHKHHRKKMICKWRGISTFVCAVQCKISSVWKMCVVSRGYWHCRSQTSLLFHSFRSGPCVCRELSTALIWFSEHRSFSSIYFRSAEARSVLRLGSQLRKGRIISMQRCFRE